MKKLIPFIVVLGVALLPDLGAALYLMLLGDLSIGSLGAAIIESISHLDELIS